VHVASASPYEPHLVPATLDARFFADLPTRLIGDRGYDSDRLDDTPDDDLRHRDDRRTPAWPCAHPRWPTAASRPPTLEGRALLRVLHHSRRAVTRWEYHVDNFLGMIQLACARMLLRAFMR
jgi:hypothetical protein